MQSLPSKITKKVVTKLTIAELFALFGSKNIVPYDKNRGGKSLSKRIIDDIAYQFNPFGIGECLLEDQGDGIYIQYDFHTRKEGIDKRVIEKFMTPDDWNTEVAVEIVPKGQGLAAYMAKNNNKPHAVSDGLRNDDTEFGKLIVKVLARATGGYKGITAPFYGIVACCAVALENNMTDNDWENIYDLRKEVQNLVKHNETAKLTDDKLGKLVDGINYYLDVVKNLTNTNNKRMENKNLTSNAGLFGVIVSDKLKQKPEFTAVTVGTLAQRLHKKNGKIKDFVSDLTKHPGPSSYKLIQKLQGNKSRKRSSQ